MKKSFALLFISSLLGSCATICGGSKYNAHILVNGHPGAEVIYQGRTFGNGTASISVKRKDANKFSVLIREKGCRDQTFNYTTRTFRGWALAGSILSWNSIGGVFFPWGMGIDFIDGAFWKPNINEKGIIKNNHKNFQYIISYSGCQSTSGEEIISPVVQDKLVDVVYLKNGSMIRGTLLDQDPTKFVKIQTADGSIFVYKIEEIEKVTRE